MFRSLTIYNYTGLPEAPEAIDEALAGAQFVPCTPTQDKSVGWVPPRGEGQGALVESVAGQLILKLRVETKAVPASAIAKRVKEAAEKIEADTGRKPGKKETRALKDDALLALLPNAFPRQHSVLVWIDRAARRLYIDASNQSYIDAAITSLVRGLDGLVMTLLHTQVTPQSAMTKWLSVTDTEEWPNGLAVERDCELRSSDEEKSVVKFTRHHLFNDEVRRHIAEGKLPVRLAMNWEGRVGFTLTESGRLDKLNFLDVDADESNKDEQDVFDTNVAISTGELRQLLPDLIAALGGEHSIQT